MNGHFAKKMVTFQVEHLPYLVNKVKSVFNLNTHMPQTVLNAEKSSEGYSAGV